MLSLIITSLLLSSTAFATPVSRASHLNCNIVNNQGAEYLVLESKTGGADIPGINSTYRLENALKEVGSHANPGTNPQVLLNTFETSFGENSNEIDFESCKSNHMGYPAQQTISGKKHWYGHVRLYGPKPKSSSSPKLCLTKHWVSTGLQFLTAEPCSYNDDSSQENQYFNMLELEVGFELADFLLTQIGAPKGKPSKTYYYQPGTSHVPGITVHPDQNTGYALHFSYLHAN